MRYMIRTMGFIVVALAATTLLSDASGQEKTATENVAVEYTCPMHPAVKAAEVGKCPKCGMALVKAEQETTPKAPAGCDRAMMQRCMAMMEKAGVSPQMMRHCRIMMQTLISMDSPNAIRAQAETLGLSEEQKKALARIEKEARKKALAVLTPEQRTRMGDGLDKPIAMSDMCKQMMPMMEKMMGGEHKGGSRMMCPMMGKESSRKGADSQSEGSGKKRVE